jgi:hypothetical protein
MSGVEEYLEKTAKQDTRLPSLDYIEFASNLPSNIPKPVLCIYCNRIYDQKKEPDHEEFCQYAGHSSGRIDDS